MCLFYPSPPEPTVTAKAYAQASGYTILPEHLYRPAAGQPLLNADLTPQAKPAPFTTQLVPLVRSTVTYIHIRSELDKKSLPLEAQLPHLGPVKSIDLREALRKESTT